MKSWIAFSDGATGSLRVILHKLGAFLARLFLFGSLFLLHSGERYSCDIGRPTAPSREASLGVAPQPAAEYAPTPPNDVPPQL